ncbi:SMI1/KNR4 family protein [Pseudoalteromonas sp. R3]|uniref:SMI1/KNR4 family protein n=1 Tax=Pseudoalteromonas sp. R3 TaxID=1709477 RepID=UPI0006B4B38A|nr:SMI1/KNR4 family protein [Pseudoalteromonas sp. R3]AZZ98453.1 hypothetical protein ELR70_15825 [Pseudoalteromonas sp. R3]
MNRRDIEINLKKLESSFALNDGLSVEELHETERNLGVVFPPQVANFYQCINGFSVKSPALVMHSAGNMVKHGSLIEFAVFNGSVPVAFDVSRVNSSGQWDVVNLNTKYVITLTMASFLTSRIWAWLSRGREVWAEEVYT